MKLVSACLLGINCNYKGSSKPDAKLLKLLKSGELFPVCPSVMVGFAQMESLPKSFERMVRSILFETRTKYEYSGYPFYVDGYPD